MDLTDCGGCMVAQIVETVKIMKKVEVGQATGGVSSTTTSRDKKGGVDTRKRKVEDTRTRD